MKVNELFLDPIGSNNGRQIIELLNTSDAPFIAPADWTFCIPPAYIPIPMVEVPAGGIVQLHIGDSGVNTSKNWYLPGLVQVPLESEFAIYATPIFFNRAVMIREFVTWGGAGSSTNVGVAVEAGVWPSISEQLALPLEGSSSLARFGSGTGPDAFYVDSTPTLGSPNEPASFEIFGTGCLADAAIPEIRNAFGALPWLAESFSLELSSLPPAGIPFGILGDSDTMFGDAPLPLDLGILGFPGCHLWVSADVFSPPLANLGGTATWTFDIPGNLPSLVGKEYFFQGVVFFGAGDAAVTNACGVVVGGPR